LVPARVVEHFVADSTDSFCGQEKSIGLDKSYGMVEFNFAIRVILDEGPGRKSISRPPIIDGQASKIKEAKWFFKCWGKRGARHHVYF
jgi:hypothetical protein